jgi:diguanylate cyclase (GGDEF)-like protein
MIDAGLVILTSNLAQAAGAMVLALLLLGFYRQYRRPYLLTWARSWGAFFASLIGASISISLLSHNPYSPWRLAASSLSLVGAYWQAAWLLFGTYEASSDRRLPAPVRRGVLALLLLLGIASILGTLESSPNTRYFVRAGVRALGLALAFGAASYGMWRSRLHPAGLGQRMIAGSFLLFGLHQLHYFAILVAEILRLGSLRYGAYLGPFDFLFQALMGSGMVIWLLEEERQRAVAGAARIEHLTLHDPLTDLPNRELLLYRLETALGHAGRRRGRLALLFLDLDRFKVINDSLGHAMANELLKSVAGRLRQSLREPDFLARLAADEFAVLLPRVDREDEISRMAEKLLAVIRRPVSLGGGRELYVSASIGISRYPEDGSNAEELLKKSNIAKDQAKERTRDHYQVYTPGMDANPLERLALESDLRKAIGGSGLVLFYQPILEARHLRIVGVEALLRWQHPERGLLPPDEFLGLAESAGLSNSLDLWVLCTACREIQAWRRDGALSVHGAVNLSARSFERPDLVERIREVLAETGLPAACLELEITETLAMRNAEATLTVLRDLKALGLRLSIDDFGTGYSSLSYLTDFPIDTLKVDRSFVSGLGARGSDEIASAIIALAHSLEIGVIAEGVEREEQLAILRDKGCDKVQGYLFSPPVPASQCRGLALGDDTQAAQLRT